MQPSSLLPLRTCHNTGFNSIIPQSFSTGPLPLSVWRRHNASLMSRQAAAWLVIIRSVTVDLIRVPLSPSPALKMQCFVCSCFTACPTKVSQPFTGTTLAPCRGRSVLNTLVLQMETRNGKRLTPTDSCHAMAVHSARAQYPRRADVVVGALHLSRSDPGASHQSAREQGEGRCGHPLPWPCGFWLWPVRSRALVVQERCSQHSPCPAPLGRGVCQPAPSLCGWGMA